MKKIMRMLIYILAVIICFSCKKQKSDITATKEIKQTASVDIVLTENIAEPENIETNEEPVVEEEQTPEKVVVFDTSEPSIIPDTASYFLDEKHISYLLYLPNFYDVSGIKPSIFLNSKSNVKYAKIEYTDFNNRILNDDKNLGRDHWEEYDNNILIDVYYFNNRKYAGTSRFYETRNGKREPYFDYQTHIEYQDNDILYNGNKEWKIIENKIQSLDNENLYYEILSDRITVHKQDNFTENIIEYLFNGEFITVSEYKNGDLRQKLVYEKGILISDWQKFVHNGGDSIVISEYKYTCLNGEGLCQHYDGEGVLTSERELYRELDEDGFLKYQRIYHQSGSATEWIFDNE